MKTKALAATLAMVLALALFLPSGTAADLVQDISAQINQGVTILWDGQVFVPTDASGNVVQPIIYNNTVYVPLRAFGVESGCAVAWDPDTKTVSVNSPETAPEEADTESDTDSYTPRTLSLIKDFTPYQSDSAWELGSVFVNEQRCDPCFYNNSFTTSSAFWQLEQKYSLLAFELASTNTVDNAEGIWIYADGASLYNSPKIEAGQILEYEIDLSGYNKLNLVLGPHTAIIKADITQIAEEMERESE